MRVAAPIINWEAPPPAAPLSSKTRRVGGGGNPYAHHGADSDDEEERERSVLVFNNRRAHAAGVCCIAGHAGKEHLVATGSYDERLRLWDTRKLTKPVVTAQVGGVSAATLFEWPGGGNLAACVCFCMQRDCKALSFAAEQASM